jgi:hypothetical protein
MVTASALGLEVRTVRSDLTSGAPRFLTSAALPLRCRPQHVQVHRRRAQIMHREGFVPARHHVADSTLRGCEYARTPDRASVSLNIRQEVTRLRVPHLG